MINNEKLFCIVDYYSKFMVVKKVESIINQRPDMNSQSCVH